MEAASVPVLAPVASIEDLSDGESPPDRMGDRLAAPGAAPVPPKGGVAPPRIDISRASSSSHHDDSSPERELFAGGEGSGGVKLGLGFTEEMALELRSSTEELDFHGPPEVSETRQRRRKLTQQHAVPKYELEAQSEKERKDSACSDIGLLSISGRTSRLSSIGSGGSAASGVSGASHVSGGSHLSAVSQLSKTSRCSSPHRTLLETSFCGPKPIPTLSLETEYPPTESVEAALLARKTDPTGAVLPVEEVGNIINGIQTIQKAQQKQESDQPKPAVQKQHQPPPKVVLHQTTIDLEAETQTKPSKPKPKHKRRPRPKLDELSRIIPLHSEDSIETEDDAAPEVQEPEESHEGRPYTPENGIYIPLKGDSSNSTEKSKNRAHVNVSHSKAAGQEVEEVEEGQQGRPFTPENGIYIPLKGPDPVLPPKKLEVERPVRRTESDRVRKLEPERTRKKEERSRKESKSERVKSKPARSPVTPQAARPQELDDSELFKIIPLHGDTPPRQGSFETEEVSASSKFVPWNEGHSIPSPLSAPSGRRSADQDLSRTKPATLDLARLEVVKPGSGTLDLGRASKSTGSMRDESRTPSPAASLGRGSLFRRSSESSGSTKSRTSNSADSKTRKDSKNKSVFTSLFKKGGSGKERESTRRKSAESERHVSLDPKITNVEFTFSQDKKQQNAGPDAIVIPLHSPDSVAEPLMIYDPVSGKMISTRPEEELAEMQKQYQPKTEIKEVVEGKKGDALQQPPKEPRSKSAPPLVAAQGEVMVERRVERKEQPPSPPKRRFKEGAGAGGEKESAGKRDSAVSKTPSSADDSSSMTRTWSAVDGAAIVVAADVITHSVPEERPDEEGPSQPQPSTQVTPEELLPELLKLLPASETPPSETTPQQLEQPKPKAPQLAATSDERKSSESEPDSDALPLPHENGAECGDDQEKKGLVHQPDSIEDELPYVPTTLPQERSLAHPMIPIKQRVSEVRTFPIDRPRSTTPINPSTLDDYITPHEENSTCQWDKMQITLPRTDSIKSESRSRSPSGKPRTWTHFVEQGMPHRGSTPPTPPPSPPPLPPRATAAWVSFEEVPERRRAPKRITTLPSSAPPTASHAHAHTVLSYVNPEECSCECHDVTHSGPPSGRSGTSRCHDVTHSGPPSGKGAGSCGLGSRHRPDLPGVETLRRDKSKTRNYRT